jgi:phage terminase small subunit
MAEMLHLRLIHGAVIPHNRRRAADIVDDDFHLYHGKDRDGRSWVFGLSIDTDLEPLTIPNTIDPFGEDVVKRMNTLAKDLGLDPKRFRSIVITDGDGDDD